jgi:diphthine-ammonia ligase
VKVATLGLEKKHLGSNLRDVRDHLHKMVLQKAIICFSSLNTKTILSFKHDQYGINICGEGGEYETFTLDCPLFCKSISV